MPRSLSNRQTITGAMPSKPVYGFIPRESGTYLVERDIPDITTAQRTLFPIQAKDAYIASVRSAGLRGAATAEILAG